MFSGRFSDQIKRKSQLELDRLREGDWASRSSHNIIHVVKIMLCLKISADYYFFHVLHDVEKTEQVSRSCQHVNTNKRRREE